MGERVRIGFGLGTATAAGEPDTFAALVGQLEDVGFDSLWLSERVAGPAPDPLAALGVAAGLSRRLKLGTSVLVVPGRNPVLLAAQLATLDRLSGGRLLPAVGLGIADTHEQQAFGVGRGERGAWLDEVVPLLHRLWTGEPVDHHGSRFHLDGVRVRPAPLQARLDVWLGGSAPSELRRTGRIGDGWLPSFVTPAEARDGRAVVEQAAAECEREIDPGHWGALVPYSHGELPSRVAELLSRRRPEVDPASLVPSDLLSLRRRLEAFVEVGFTKLVVVPVTDPPSWTDEIESLAGAVLPLQA